MDSMILLYIIKLIIGGVISFSAIMIMSKTRALEWMLIVSGFLISYIALVLNMCFYFNILADIFPRIAGISLFTILEMLLPAICFVAGFIVKFTKKNI